MRKFVLVAPVLLAFAVAAPAQELTWRNGIGNLFKDKCGECHGVSRPEFQGLRSWATRSWGPAWSATRTYMTT